MKEGCTLSEVRIEPKNSLCVTLEVRDNSNRPAICLRPIVVNPEESYGKLERDSCLTLVIVGNGDNHLVPEYGKGLNREPR